MFSYLRKNWNAPQGYRDVLRVGLPLLAGMASTTVMQFTDRLFLSHYSTEAIAASMASAMPSFTIQMTLQGICSYAGVLAAQYVGARAPHRVGPAIWQGIWCALICTTVLIAACFLAGPLFSLAGHDPEIMELEVQYFITLTAGASMALLGASVSAFFFGRGITKPVMIANIVAAVINVPLDYALIFGFGPIPEMGIIGAGLATCCGWLSTLVLLSFLVFTRKNDQIFYVRRGWRFEVDLFKRLVRYGIPSGINLFVEFMAMTWFMFELGRLGKVALAASTIAFSVNSLTFMPMLGLNMATATLVGQAMGRNAPLQAERVSYHALHLAFIYMVSTAILVVVFAGQLMDVFKGDKPEILAIFPQVRETGVILLYYVALYSVVDATNLIFFGTLKGAGDTLVMMKIIVSCVLLVLIVPMVVLNLSGQVGLHTLWIIFTLYIFVLALCVYIRFRSRKWHHIRVIEKNIKTDPGAPDANAV